LTLIVGGRLLTVLRDSSTLGVFTGFMKGTTPVLGIGGGWSDCNLTEGGRFVDGGFGDSSPPRLSTWA
jgi:hypothetical protein